jgi:predicted lipoprotein
MLPRSALPHPQPLGRGLSAIRVAIVTSVLSLAAAIGLVAIGVASVPTAPPAAGSANTLVGLEKSMVILWTMWTGRIDVSR